MGGEGERRPAAGSGRIGRERGGEARESESQRPRGGRGWEASSVGPLGCCLGRERKLGSSGQANSPVAPAAGRTSSSISRRVEAQPLSPMAENFRGG